MSRLLKLVAFDIHTSARAREWSCRTLKNHLKLDAT